MVEHSSRPPLLLSGRCSGSSEVDEERGGVVNKAQSTARGSVGEVRSRAVPPGLERSVGVTKKIIGKSW